MDFLAVKREPTGEILGLGILVVRGNVPTIR